MPYKYQPGKLYRMPTHFGPSLGPRQGQDGQKFDNAKAPRTTNISVSFLSNRDQLEALIPEGFEIDGEPVVTVRAGYMTEIEWLAGRGYNVLGVSFPVIFNGKQDRARGDLLTVLWENLADPIITGREDLGFNKIYCELPEPIVLRGETHCIATWLGFRFLDITVRNLTPVPPEEFPPPVPEQAADGTLTGMLHYKYIPKTGDWGEADVEYATLTPAHTPNRVVTEMWSGEGTVEFHKATWEDLPTLYTIVNAFNGLEIKEYRGASIVKTIGGKDLSDQRILR